MAERPARPGSQASKHAWTRRLALGAPSWPASECMPPRTGGPTKAAHVSGTLAKMQRPWAHALTPPCTEGKLRHGGQVSRPRPSPGSPPDTSTGSRCLHVCTQFPRCQRVPPSSVAASRERCFLACYPCAAPRCPREGTHHSPGISSPQPTLLASQPTTPASSPRPASVPPCTFTPAPHLASSPGQTCPTTGRQHSLPEARSGERGL